MAYKLSKLTYVAATPSTGADTFAAFTRDTILFGTGKSYLNPDDKVTWINVRVLPGVLDGWIPSTNCTEVDDPGPQPLDLAAFVRECTLADRVINGCGGIAPWFVTADFIIARAIFETGIMQASYDPPYESGPFKLSSAEWSALLSAGLPFAADYSVTDARYPMLQVYAAGYSMHADATAISDAISVPDSPEDLGPVLPSYLDLFHAYLGGTKFAVDVKASETDTSKVLSDLLSPEDLAALLNRPQFNGIKNSTTVKSFVGKTEVMLAAVLDAAFDKIKTFAGDELPSEASGGGAPWLDVAKAELNAKVSEASSPDRIRSYFAATDYGSVKTGIPNWCGAFAAYCMKQASVDDLPKGSAQASKWKSWGTRDIPLGSHTIPVGAVVVLSPAPGTNTSGHVGFFTSFSDDGKSIQLIGGNQSKAVTEMPCLVPRIVAIRVSEDVLSTIGSANRFDLTAAKVPKEWQRYGDLIVDRFQRAGLTRDQQLIAALANAIAESGLNPKVSPNGSERSYGLFQCNIDHGLGIGFTREQLEDPDTNITIIIRNAQKYSKYTSASSVAAAVDAFVRYVERPKDTTGAIKRRLEIAQQLA